MIKVLDKTFSILEGIIASSAYRPLRVSELSERCGINNATCARILKELADSGYIRQVSRQEGYTAGPRAVALFNLLSYKPKIMDAARNLVSEAADTYAASVLYCERNGTERFILAHHCSSAKLNVRILQTAYHDLTGTATGLVLSAYAPVPEQNRIMEVYRDVESDLHEGIPLKTLFSRIRREGRFLHLKEHVNQALVAFPVFLNNVFAGVLGSSVEWEYTRDAAAVKRWTEGIERSASELSKSISFIDTIG